MLLVSQWLDSRWAVNGLVDILWQSIIAVAVFAAVAAFSCVRRDERTWVINRVPSVLPGFTVEKAAPAGDQHA